MDAESTERNDELAENNHESQRAYTQTTTAFPPAPNLIDEAGRFWRFIYNHNPFYVISAALVLRGLRMSFEPGPEGSTPWLLLGLLAGYTLLLTATTVWVVRWGQVWEDARTLLLIVVILLLTISMLFDDLVISNPQQGKEFLLVGLVCAIVASELLLTGLQLRLPFWYRISYLSLLSTFYTYPIYLRTLFRSVQWSTMGWGVYGFSWLCAASFLLLIPAVRKGREYVRDNGTPWSWPWYPTPLFVVLLVGCFIRSYLLARSFQPVPGHQTMFGFYFYAPMLLAVAVLLMETAVTSRSRFATGLGMLAPLVIVASSYVNARNSYLANQFFLEFVYRAGSPLYMALIASALLYAFAWARGMRAAETGAVACLFALTVVGFQTTSEATMTTFRPTPFLALSLFLAATTWLNAGSWRFALTATAAVATGTILMRGTWWTENVGAIPWHVWFVSLVVIGVLVRDAYSDQIQAVAVLFSVLAPVVVVHQTQLSWVWAAAYLLAMSIGLIAMGLWGRSELYYWAGVFNLGHLVLWGGSVGLNWLLRLPRGVLLVLSGMTSFLIAGYVSFLKAKAVRRDDGRLPAPEPPR